MAEYKGTKANAERVRQLEKQRAAQVEQLERRKADIKNEASKSSFMLTGMSTKLTQVLPNLYSAI